jgi:hypothetical protein
MHKEIVPFSLPVDQNEDLVEHVVSALELMKVFCSFLILMIILMFWMLLKSFLPKKLINSFKNFWLSLILMKHVIFMGYFKGDKSNEV